MPSKRADSESEASGLPSRLEDDRPEDRDLLDRLTTKLRRLDREAVRLAVTMRQKPKLS